jgi:hypothetical protein
MQIHDEVEQRQAERRAGADRYRVLRRARRRDANSR